jgi:hypothetical protein
MMELLPGSVMGAVGAVDSFLREEEIFGFRGLKEGREIKNPAPNARGLTKKEGDPVPPSIKG